MIWERQDRYNTEMLRYNTFKETGGNNVDKRIGNQREIRISSHVRVDKAVERLASYTDSFFLESLARSQFTLVARMTMYFKIRTGLLRIFRILTFNNYLVWAKIW